MGGWLTGSGWKRGSTAATGLMAVAALAAAGCSSGTSSSGAAPQSKTPAQEIQLAAATAGTVNSFTATINLDLTTGTSQGTTSVTVAGTMSEVVHPSVLAEFTFPTLEAAGASLPGGMSEIITRSEIYLKLAELTTLLHTDKPWLGVSVSSLPNSSGLNLGSLFSSSESSNPLTMAQLLAGATDVKRVGTGTVDGVPVTEYTGSYTLAAALARLPASVRSSASSAFKQAGLDSGTARFTVWIDAQNIVRKDITVLTWSKLSETIAATVTSINQPVTITPPPASQVFALTSADLGAAEGV